MNLARRGASCASDVHRVQAVNLSVADVQWVTVQSCKRRDMALAE